MSQYFSDYRFFFYRLGGEKTGAVTNEICFKKVKYRSGLMRGLRENHTLKQYSIYQYMYTDGNRFWLQYRDKTRDLQKVLLVNV